MHDFNVQIGVCSGGFVDHTGRGIVIIESAFLPTFAATLHAHLLLLLLMVMMELLDLLQLLELLLLLLQLEVMLLQLLRGQVARVEGRERHRLLRSQLLGRGRAGRQLLGAGASPTSFSRDADQASAAEESQVTTGCCCLATLLLLLLLLPRCVVGRGNWRGHGNSSRA